MISPKEELPLATRPRPWPFYLAITTPLLFFAILTWCWSQKEYTLTLRIGWVALCSFLPGLAVATIVGSLTQLRKRPMMSILSLLIGGITLAACFWAIQQISANVNTLLP